MTPTVGALGEARTARGADECMEKVRPGTGREAGLGYARGRAPKVGPLEGTNVAVAEFTRSLPFHGPAARPATQYWRARRTFEIGSGYYFAP